MLAQVFDKASGAYTFLAKNDPALVIENHQRGKPTHTEELIQASRISHGDCPAFLLEKSGHAAAVGWGAWFLENPSIISGNRHTC